VFLVSCSVHVYKISNFCFAQKIEKAEMMKDMTQNTGHQTFGNFYSCMVVLNQIPGDDTNKSE
jgi:hypothetical protein